MNEKSIFISYRRDDSAGEAGRIHDHLVSIFGEDRVFFDISGISPGADFVTVLKDAIQRSHVCLVVIGKRWISAADSAGKRRLDDPGDFVRLEVATSLARNITVIPLLIQGASLPAAADLPEELRSLVRREAVRVDHDEFDRDMDSMISTLEAVAGRPLKETVTQKSRLRWIAAVCIVLVFGAIAAVGYRQWRISRERQALESKLEPMLSIASGQLQSRRFEDAWNTLEAARRLAPNNDRVRIQQEDLALTWVESASGKDYADVAAVAQKLQPVLEQGGQIASGVRRANLWAHVGWATFLRWRGGEFSLKPESDYQRALIADPNNPYAHVMLAHWMLWEGRDLAGARQHLLTALDHASGPSAATVRLFGFSALTNQHVSEFEAEVIRFAEELRKRNQPSLDAVERHRIWNVYWSYIREPETLLQAMPPKEQLRTFHWIFDAATEDEQDPLGRTFWKGLLMDRAGFHSEGQAVLKALAIQLRNDPGSLADATNKALTVPAKAR